MSDREILFRGKRVDNGEWIEGDLIRSLNDGVLIMQTIHDEGNMLDHPPCDYQESANVIPETVGQYIGLEDKNGKKIFKGDLFRYNYYPMGVDKKAVQYYKIGEVVDYGFIIWRYEGLNIIDKSLAMPHHKEEEEVYYHPTAGKGWVDTSHLHTCPESENEVIGTIHDKINSNSVQVKPNTLTN